MGHIFVAIVLLLVMFAEPSRAESQLERGRYLVETVAACGNCHTPKGPNGPLTDKKLAGGDIIKHADFTAATPNITPDPETGIGKWTDHQIFAAIREGRRPDGTLIGPAMTSKRSLPICAACRRYTILFASSHIMTIRSLLRGGRRSVALMRRQRRTGSPMAPTSPARLPAAWTVIQSDIPGSRPGSGAAESRSTAPGAPRSPPISPQTKQVGSAIGAMPRSSGRSALAWHATATNSSRQCRLPRTRISQPTIWQH